MDERSEIVQSTTDKGIMDKGFITHGQNTGGQLNDKGTGEDLKVKKSFERHAHDEDPRPVERKTDNKDVDDFNSASNWNSDWEQ